MADALGTPGGVVSDEDHRIALAGMVAPQTSSLAVRSGVLVGPGSNALVTGTSATGTMTVSIAPHHAITSRATADGVYFGPNLEAATTVNIAAAPGSNSRIDVVYVKQNDTGSSVSVDSGSTQPLYGVVTGTAAVSPTKPSLSAITGATELATVTVAAGATSTNGAGVTIANTALQTVMRGGIVPVRNTTERNAMTGHDALVVKRIDTGYLEVWRTGTTYDTYRPDTLLNGGTSGVLVGSAPSAGTKLLTKTWYGTVTTSAAGDATVTFPGGAFPNGLVAVNAQVAFAAPANAPIFYQAHTPTLSSIGLRAYAANVGGANTVGASLSIGTSVTAIGW